MNGAAQSSSCNQQVFVTADYLRAGCRQACVTGLGKRLGKIPFVAEKPNFNIKMRLIGYQS
jgi:hypothetical protein